MAAPAENDAWDRLLRPSEVPDEWREVLLRIPGYDSIATAGDARFDPEAARQAIEFFPECIRHVEGAQARQPFVLEPWQQAVNANVFGWKRIDELGRLVRRYTEALVYVPRKNGKTPWMAGLGLYVLFCDDEPGQQDYIAADTREQAGKLFRQAKGMVELEPELKKRCRVYGGTAQAGQAKSIVPNDDPASFLQVISADASSQHGGNTHIAIVDELHAQPNRELIDVLTTSTASLNRKQTLMIYITTADYDRPSICNEKHDYAGKVRDGVIKDHAFLPVIYEAGRDDPWDSEEVWRKANPNLGVSVSLDYLRGACKKAKEMPAFENTFRRLHLNQKTEQADRVISMDRWDAGKKAVDREAMKGTFCCGGLDIGARSDFTALVLAFPGDDVETVEVPADYRDPDGAKQTVTRRSFTLLPYFWLPSSPVKRDPRMESVIDAWRREGHVKTTPGNEVDYGTVFDDILALAEEFSIAKLAIDRGFQGMSIGQNLVRHFGPEIVIGFQQGIVWMNAPFRELLDLVSQGRLHHDGNPVLRWMASSTAAEHRQGLIKPCKDKSTEKIDGITAATMALGVALLEPDMGSVKLEVW